MSLEICVDVFSVLANPAQSQCSGLVLGSALGSQHGCWDWWTIQTSSCGDIRPLNWTAGWTTVTQEQSWEWGRDKEATGLHFIQNRKKESSLFFLLIAFWLEMTRVKLANSPRWAKSETLKMIQQILSLWFTGETKISFQRQREEKNTRMKVLRDLFQQRK